jgi:hypothetical protein
MSNEDVEPLTSPKDQNRIQEALRQLLRLLARQVVRQLRERRATADQSRLDHDGK